MNSDKGQKKSFAFVFRKIKSKLAEEDGKHPTVKKKRGPKASQLSKGFSFRKERHHSSREWKLLFPTFPGNKVRTYSNYLPCLGPRGPEKT